RAAAPPARSPLSLHDALPIFARDSQPLRNLAAPPRVLRCLGLATHQARALRNSAITSIRGYACSHSATDASLTTYSLPSFNGMKISESSPPAPSGAPSPSFPFPSLPFLPSFPSPDTPLSRVPGASKARGGITL